MGLQVWWGDPRGRENDQNRPCDAGDVDLDEAVDWFVGACFHDGDPIRKEESVMVRDAETGEVCIFMVGVELEQSFSIRQVARTKAAQDGNRTR